MAERSPLVKLIADLQQHFHTLVHGIDSLENTGGGIPDTSLLIQELVTGLERVEGLTDNESLNALAERLQRTLKQLEETLASTDDDTGSQHFGVLRKEVKVIQDLVARTPEIASVLDVSPSVIDPKPINLPLVVDPSVFTQHESIKKQPTTPWAAAAAALPHRELFDRPVSENAELVPLEMVGKVRVAIADQAGDPVFGAPFAITAVFDHRIVALGNAVTNRRGYGVVDLQSIRKDGLTDLSVRLEVGGDAEGSAVIFSIDVDHFTTHRDLGLPHKIKLHEAVADEVADTRNATTIDDPDSADLDNDGEGFGFKISEEDGTCCIKPNPEIASRQYFFSQLVRVGDAPKLVFSGTPFGSREEVKGPIPFSAEHPDTYSLIAGNIVTGRRVTYRQSWSLAQVGIGQPLYSLALAPCEKVNIAVIDWRRDQEDTRGNATQQSESLTSNLARERDIDETVKSVLTEWQEGRTTAGGGGAALDLGYFAIGGGGGTTKSTTEGYRNLIASTTQDISDRIVQRASSYRSQRSTVVTTTTQSESEQITTRAVHNHNQNHSMTIQYFQVLAHYKVSTEVHEEQDVVFIPYAIDQRIFDRPPKFEKFKLTRMGPIIEFLLEHESVLRPLVPRRYRGLFESLNRLTQCADVYKTTEPYATASRWHIALDSAWRQGVKLSIEQKGRTFPLHPVGSRNVSQFRSDPVRLDLLTALRVSFDASEAIRSSPVPAWIEVLQQFKLQNVDLSVELNRSQFVRNATGRHTIRADTVDATLGIANPTVTVGLTSPNLTDAFEGFVSREEHDYCLLKQLVTYIQSNPLRFLRAIWLSENPDRRAIRFDRFEFSGEPLLHTISNTPVGVFGNMVAFPLLEQGRLVRQENPQISIQKRMVSLPTRGVFAEVFLSCCNATERRDISRAIDPSACAADAPAISGITPGSRNAPLDTTSAGFASALVGLQNAPDLPDPTGLAAALEVLRTPNIFRDLSNGAELLSFINNAALQAMQSTAAFNRQSQVLAAQLAAGSMGIPLPSGGGGGQPASIPGIQTRSESPGAAVNAANSQALRSTSPRQVNDHLANIEQARQRGLLNDQQAGAAARGLLAGPVDAVDSSSSIGSLIGAGSAPQPAGSQQSAQYLIAAFKSSSGRTPWKLDRSTVADRLSELVAQPTRVDQGNVNLCGPAALFRLWFERDPTGAVRYATTLFDTGKTNLGSVTVEPSSDLVEQDYAALVGNSSLLTPQADWMCLGALRDVANIFLDFEGTPEENVSGATTPSELSSWMKLTGIFANVIDDGRWFFTRDTTHAIGLMAGSTSRDVVLLVNSHMLQSTNGGNVPKKSDEFILSAFPNHFVILESPVRRQGGNVRFSFWSWGQSNQQVDVAESVFEANYYGAVIGERRF